VNRESLSPNYASWLHGFWQDLQPASGRLHSALRITLATALALVLFMVWQMPFAAYGLYAVFLISRESVSASLRLGIAVLLTAALVIAVELSLIIATDNDPMARVIGISVIAFLAGMVIAGSTFPALGSSWGLLCITVIGFWENHSPADILVKNSLRLLAAFCLGIGCAVAVEYVFGVRSPADRLAEQFRIRYQALQRMFSSFAAESDFEQRFAAASQVSRLAAAGQAGMMALYNQVADRNVDTSVLPIGARVHITMLAELMDDSAAFGLQSKTGDDAESGNRCARIAEKCRHLSRDVTHRNEVRFVAPPPTPHNLLDRVERGLAAILLMPCGANDTPNKELIGVPSKKVPIIIPGAMRNRSNIAFSLKLSLCATICYIIYHAVDWPGLSTCVITVMVAGLTTTGAMKQRFAHRFLGAVIGGLLLGLGTVTFLFPDMDSITSLVILVGAVAFLAGWTSGGPRFNYVGLQIAFSFYLVTLQGFGPSTALAPARDRVVGIFFALVVMWLVFDRIWPVRTVTAMRRLLASVLRSTVSVIRLVDAAQQPDEVLRTTESLRDRVGKDIATLRTLGEATEYEFGVDREQHIRASGVMLRIAVTAAGVIWNQLALLRDEENSDLIDEPSLLQLRGIMAEHLETMAEVIVQKTNLRPKLIASLVRTSLIGSEHVREYTQNTITLFEDIEALTLGLSQEA
jgi:multidrug resistance protein MdtO